MTADELADQLLALPDGEQRQQFFHQHPSALDLELAEALKARSDALLLSDPNRSLQIASAALQVAAFSSDALVHGVALWAQGNALLYLGDYRSSLAVYRQAQVIYEHANLQLEAARLLVNQAAALRNLAEYAEALHAASLARKYLEPLGPTRYLAILEMNVGAVHRQQGHYQQAWAAFASGREIFVALEDHVQAARMDVNRANVLENLDRFSEAESLLETARASLAGEDMALEVARVDLNLGITTFRQGRYQAALRHFERAHDGFESLHQAVEMAVVDLHRSRTYLALNLLPETVQLAHKARRVLEKQGLQREVAACLVAEAQALRRQGDRLAAMRALNRARQAYRRMDAPIEAALLDMERASLLREAREPRAGWRIVQRTARFLASHRLPARQAQAQVVQSQCALALDWLDRAHKLAQDALQTGQALGLADVVWSAYYILGQIAERQKQESTALESYEAAVAAIERLSVALLVDEFRAGFLVDKIAVYESAIRLALILGQTEAAFHLTQRVVTAMLLGVPAAAQDLAELGKADRDLGRKLEHLRRAWHWKHSTLESTDLGGALPSDGLVRSTEVMWQELKSLEEQIIELRRRWQVRRAGAGQPMPDYLSPADTQAQLNPTEALIQYVVTDSQVGAFVVLRDRLEYLPDLAPLSDIVQVIEAWRFTLEVLRLYPAETLRPHIDTWCADAQAHMSRLYQLMFAPLETWLVGIERLHLVLYPTLPIIPFAALYDGKGYLVERFQVTWLPAATLLFGPRTPLPGGNPVVVGYSDGGRLPFAVAEAERVADVLADQAAVLLTEEAATEPALRRHLVACNLLHLATHATFRPDNPFFSWVRLADAHLAVTDLYDLALPAHPLIVLSACETGLVGQRGGGLIGLSRAWLAAGASALVVSLWKVDDAATADLMETFYREYSSGLSTAAALQRAQQHLSKRHPHPFYWAPFALVGRA